MVIASATAHCGVRSPHLLLAIMLESTLGKYNPHYTHGFNFNLNADGHVECSPHDAYWKFGASGYPFYVVPSLDMVIYQIGGTEEQYDPKLTRLPVKYRYDGSRDHWKPGDPNLIADSATKTLRMVLSAVVN